LYFASAEPVKAARSAALLRQGGVVSPQVLNEFASVSLGKKRRLTFVEVRTTLNAVLACCLVTPLTVETHLTGLTYAETHRLSLYEAMIVASAVLAGCSVLYSEDMHNGRVIDGVTVTNPYKP
jgi:predicted nucleic acid-binding protein